VPRRKESFAFAIVVFMNGSTLATMLYATKLITFGSWMWAFGFVVAASAAVLGISLKS